MVGPLAGADGDPGVPTINTKNIDGGPLGLWGVGSCPCLGDDGGPEASTINTKKRQRWHPGRRCRRSGSAHHQHKEMLMVGLLGGDDGDSGAPTINTKKHRRWAPWKAVPEVRQRPP
jgi:hypothetical protein